MSRIAADVCVIGAGPAGTITALELARLGFVVRVLHRPVVRSRWPETISLGALRVLHRIGLTEVVTAAALTPIVEKRLWMSPGKNPQRRAEHHTVLVERDRFDDALRMTATAAGVDIMQAAAVPPVRLPDGRWRVGYEHGEVDACAVVIAAGRRWRDGATIMRSPRTVIAYYGICRDLGLPLGAMAVGRCDSHWFWSAAEPGGLCHVVAFATTSRRRHRPHVVLQRSAAIQGAPSAHVSFVRAADATVGVAAESVRDGVIRVGDALATVDPSTSSGLYVAALSAVQAARVINTALRRPADAGLATAFYRTMAKQMFEHYRSFSDEFYEGPPASGAAAGQQPIIRSSLDDLVLRRGFETNDVAVLQEDFVTAVPGLETPPHRPSAFIEGMPIDRLLAPLRTGKSVAEAIGDWTEISDASRTRLIERLVELDIVVPRSSG